MPRQRTADRKPTFGHLLGLVACALLLGACQMPQEIRHPRLDITSRTETDPKITCTNCQCTGDQCFCDTCTITADTQSSN